MSVLLTITGLFALLSGASGAKAIRSLESSIAEDQINHDAEIQVHQLQIAVLRCSQALSAFLAGDAAARGPYEESKQQLPAYVGRVTERTRSESDRKRVAHLAAELDRFDMAAERAFFLAKKGEDRDAFRAVRTWIEQKMLPTVEQDVSGLIETFRSRSLAAEIEAVRGGEKARLLILVSSCALVGVVLGTSILLRRWIVRPLTTLRAATRDIADGRYETKVDVHGAHEFGRLARDVEQMAAHIAESQSKLVEKERYAAVGEMTATIAHNIRNPLGSIRALAQASRNRVAPEDPIYEPLGSIMKTVDRADRWLKDLLVALRPVKVESLREDVNAMLEEAASAVRDFASIRHVRLETQLERRLPLLEVDRRKLSQAVISLLSNAIEATPAGGVVRLVSQRDPARRHHAEIVVEDQGPGIPEAEQDKVFSPNFTTKVDGTGLGLSLCQRIVFAHRGHITIDSKPGAGCRMRVALPIPEAEAENGAGTDPR